MSKGYIIFAYGEKFIRMADFLKRNIKSTQEINNVTIVNCDSNIMLERTRAYELSPYDETVMLDADMIFLDNIDHWWNHFDKFPLLITDKVKTFRGEWVTDTPFRITFTSNKLPNCYSAFTYFKRDTVTAEFFKLLREIVLDWDRWSWTYTPVNRQTFPSIDIAMGIAVAHMNITPFTPLDYPTFTHMKPANWREKLHSDIQSGQIKIGNYIQTGILHYVDKDVVNELSSAF